MGAVLWPIRQYNLLITLPLGAAVYFVMLFVTGFAGKKKLKWPLNPLKKSEHKCNRNYLIKYQIFKRGHSRF